MLVLTFCSCACQFLAPSLLFLVPPLLFCRMFYFFFESRNSKKDPVVIWLTGGPGCSSELAMFYENGPFTIADNLTLVWNEYGWDQVCLIFQFPYMVGLYYFKLYGWIVLVQASIICLVWHSWVFLFFFFDVYK